MPYQFDGDRRHTMHQLRATPRANQTSKSADNPISCATSSTVARTVHNVFEALNTWFRSWDIVMAGKILAQLDCAEKPPKPYTRQELKILFAVTDDEENCSMACS